MPSCSWRFRLTEAMVPVIYCSSVTDPILQVHDRTFVYSFADNVRFFLARLAGVYGSMIGIVWLVDATSREDLNRVEVSSLLLVMSENRLRVFSLNCWSDMYLLLFQ